MIARLTLIITLVCTTTLYGVERDRDRVLNELFSEGVVVDLREPIYSEGVLTTDKGGVITAPNIRVQGLRLAYIRKMVDGEPVCRIEAEGNLMVEYHDKAFVGESLEYDFTTCEGVVRCGRGALAPWFFGGELIELCADGSYIINNGYLTTSANKKTDWQIRASRVKVSDQHLLSANNVQFRFIKLPLFWLPSYRTNLHTLWKPPIKYHARWSGALGPRIGFSYLVWGQHDWNTFLLLDYSFKRGLGGGIETLYEEDCGPRRLYSKSYYAKDASVQDPNQRERYRFAGSFHDAYDCDAFVIDVGYDKLSDKYMATDYYQKGFDSRTIGRSHATIHRKEASWMASIHTHFRLNDFQTVKQELPTVSTSLRPWTMGSSGIVSDSRGRVSYLMFRYDKDLIGVNNFDASRIEVDQHFYRHISVGQLVFTPSAGANAIYYGDGPNNDPVDQIVGQAGCKVFSHLHRFYGCAKHNISPYVDYNIYSTSSRPIDDHYLFDIDDGWYTLNMLRFGLINTLYFKRCDDSVQRKLFLDIWANAFFYNKTMEQSIPKAYSALEWKVTDRLNYLATAAWDFERQEVDHYNLRAAWTYNEDLAISAEFRHREDYAWRKVDYNNFVLDSYHTEVDLRNSSLSDRRDTFLAHLFYRFCPTWAFELKSRSGWHRRTQPNLWEYQVDLHGSLRGQWKIRLTYQHEEDDSRVALNISLGASPPKDTCCPTVKMARGNY